MRSRNITRRRFISEIVAATAPTTAVLCAPSRAHPLPTAPQNLRIGTPTPPPSGLWASIELSGATYTYTERNSVDLGDYTGPGFIQRCLWCTHPNLPLTVFFRPDRESTRVEVVFELGRCFGPANDAAADLPPYVARIGRGSETLAVIPVPAEGAPAGTKHWWFSRWRWQSQPRPVITTSAALIASHKLLPYSMSGLTNLEAPSPTAYRGPLDSAGMVRNFSDNSLAESHLISEFAAHYILTGSESSLDSLFAEAEAAGSLPWNIRDEETGAPIDLRAHPYASWNRTKPSNAEFAAAWIRTTSPSIADGGWNIDNAHMHSLSYVPFLLTGDPYHLEELQFQGNWNAGDSHIRRSRTDARGRILAQDSAKRMLACSYRNWGQLALVTPESTPRWLLPRSYWASILDDNRTWWIEKWQNDPSPLQQQFHFLGAVDVHKGVSAFQSEMLNQVLLWLVEAGFAAWAPLYEWHIQEALARTNGTSGWNRRWTSPDHPDYTVSNPETTWGELWETFKARYAGCGVNMNESTWGPHPTFWPQTLTKGLPSTAECNAQPEFELLQYTVGSLAQAARYGIPGAYDCYRFTREIYDAQKSATSHGGRSWRLALLGPPPAP